MRAATAELPECFRVTGDSGPQYSSLFSADRVDILNIDKLVFSFKIRFCGTDTPEKLTSRLRISDCPTESSGSGAAPLRRSPVRKAEEVE